MGLLSALNNAVSGLSVNQQQLNVLSQNISNANTANYSAESLHQQASYISGLGTGVDAGSVTRTIDQYLTSEVQGQTSINNAASTIQSYYSQIQNLLGQPGSSGTLDQNITTFFTNVQDLANSPSVSAQTTVADSASTLATQISGLATSIQNLRLQADSSIASNVSSVNADLQTLYTVNQALEKAAATGQSTAGLLDQRDTALTDIAQYIDIKPSYGQDGEVTVNTTAGITLLSTNLSKLNYSPVGAVSTFENNGDLNPITVSVLDPNGNTLGAPVTLATGGPSSSVTTSLTGGSISGLLSVRDSILPSLLTQLDGLASTIRDQTNAITNSGVSYPPPASYTGMRETQGSQLSQYTGSIRIAALGANGNPLPSPYADEPNGVQPLTLDLGTLSHGQGAGVLSTDNIIKAINEYYGPPQNKAELGNLNNVQLQVTSNTVPGSGNTMNMALNLNNISGTSAQLFVTGASVVDSSGNTVDASPTLSIPNFALSSVQTTANSNGVTITTSRANGLKDGDTIYLNPSVGSIDGLTTTQLSGYFTVSNVSGNSFQITVPGAGSVVAGGTFAAGSASITTPSATVPAGATVSTVGTAKIQANLLANVGSNPGALSSPYFTVNVTVGTVNADGSVSSSTISYQVANNQVNSSGNLIGATSATGVGKIVVPNSTQPLVTASLVDANGNPLPLINGQYGNQSGYLKITANGASSTVAIDELDSKQIGLPNAANPQPGTNQGFSQYFGLNNLFNVNQPTDTGDTVAGSALNMSVASNIQNNPSLIAVASLTQGNQPSDPSKPPNYTYQVTSGDNSISQKLAALANSTLQFAASGGMPASATTLSQYAGQVIAVTSTNSTNVTNTVTNNTALLQGYTSRAQAVSGVNLDQELANTVIYQNAYTASTRIITVVDQLFSELMNMIQ